jgi:transglutaminase-like putative cysteine protease
MSMEKKRPQLNLDELHQLKWLLGGVLALFSVWTVFFLDVDAWTLLVLNTMAILAALIRPGWLARVPVAVHVAAFPVIVICFAADLLGNGQILPAMIRLDLMLILYRGMTYRLRRDDLQLIVLGLFLVVVAGVLTVSLAFAVQILAFTACALAFLFVITLVDAAEAKDPPAHTPFFTWRISVATPSWTRHTDWRRLFSRLWAVVDWRIVTFGSVLFVGVVVLSGLLFLAIPRFQLENSLFLDRFISKKARTGFTDNIKFGDVTDIISDDGLAVSIDISNPEQMPATVYLRMVVLDEYRDDSFRLSPTLRRQSFVQDPNTIEVFGAEHPRRGPPVYWTFYLESGVSSYLPLPGSFERLHFRELQNVSFSRNLRAITLRNEPVTMTAYRLEGVNTSPLLPDAGFAESLRNPPHDKNGTPLRIARRELALPARESDQAALRAAVAEITGGAALPAEEFASRACVWLDMRHDYSLQSALPPGQGDTLTRWLTSKEPGHCELFAGAFVMLARTAGFPTRLVTGFKGGSWNAFSNNLTVRNSNAHAWCEMWNGAGAWLRVDPTPGSAPVTSTNEPEGAAAFAARQDRSWSARLDSLRIFWYRRIVNFDQGNQLDTLRAVKAATQEAGQRMRASLDRIVQAMKSWLQSAWDARRIATAAVGLLVAVALGWTGRMLLNGWRWRTWRGADARRSDPARREAGRWLERLREKKGDGMPEADAVWPDLERIRYGSRPTWPELEKVFRRARKAWRERKKDREIKSAPYRRI